MIKTFHDIVHFDDIWSSPAALFVDWRLFSEPFDVKVDHCIHNSAVPKQAKGVGACEFLIMFIIAGVWIFQVSSNSQWGNGRNRMMMGWMYKFTLFFMPYSNSHVLKVHGTYYCTFCAMCLVTESKQTPFICIIVYILWDFFLSFNLQPKSNNIPNFCLQLRGN